MTTRPDSFVTPTSATPPLRIVKRPAAERGQGEHGWLHARFTFSFGDYFDPDHMGFHSLRVMNNDTIEPGGGFPMHPHRDMEIFTYVISGQLKHEDSLGNGSTIHAGNLQYMSAGSGIRHSEFNPSRTEQTHLYQIWLHPNQLGGTPRYAEKPLTRPPTNDLTLLFSGDGREGSTSIRQNASLYFGRVKAAQELVIPASETEPHIWIQVVEGSVSAHGTPLNVADGLQIENAAQPQIISAQTDATLIVFRLAPIQS